MPSSWALALAQTGHNKGSALVAQRIEQLPSKQWVVGSSPAEGSKCSAMTRSSVPLLAFAALAVAGCSPGVSVEFEAKRLTSEFVAESCAVGDLDGDGHVDLVAGPIWWKGPGFAQQERLAPAPAKPLNPRTQYSDAFITHLADLDEDGDLDVVQFDEPGAEVVWLENPSWTRHQLAAKWDNESPTLADLDGDGRPEIVGQQDGAIAYGIIARTNPKALARIVPIGGGDQKKLPKYTHGLGVGDVDGDGLNDVLWKGGWFQQKRGGWWASHQTSFSPKGGEGGAQMIVTDVDGDGLNDVVCSPSAHGEGLDWYRQVRSGRRMDFVRRSFDLPHFTQPHALAAADFDGDGVLDYVTGKRKWAHGPSKDPEPDADPVLYVLLTRREGKHVRLQPVLVDDQSGVGTQITIADLNGDGKLDIASANKSGVSVFFRR